MTQRSSSAGNSHNYRAQAEHDGGQQYGRQQSQPLDRVANDQQELQEVEHDSSMADASTNELTMDTPDDHPDADAASNYGQPSQSNEQEGDDENSASHDKKDDDEEKSQEKSGVKGNKETGSSKRKRDASSENTSPPPTKKKKTVLAIKESPFLWPSEQDLATAKLGQRDDTRFKSVLTRRSDGTKDVWEYSLEKQANFDWDDPKCINDLNKARHQRLARAGLRRGNSSKPWTVEEAEVLRKIVHRAMKTAKKASALNWTKINRRFWDSMKGKKAPEGMKHAISNRSIRANKDADPVSVGASGSTGNNGKAPKAKRVKKSMSSEEKEARAIAKAVKEAAREATRFRAAKLKPTLRNQKSGTVSRKSRNTTQKFSKRRSQTDQVKEEYEYTRRKTTAVKRQADYLDEVKKELRRRTMKPRGADDSVVEDSDPDSEFSCGDEDSESSEEDSESDTNPDLEGDSDEGQDGQRPAGNALEGTLVSAV